MKILGHDIPWLDKGLLYTLGVLALIFLALGVSSCEVKKAKAKQASAEAIASERQKESDAYLMNLNSAKIAMADLQNRNDELTQKVKNAEAQLAHHPIPQPTPPPSDKEMAGYLVEHGIKPGLTIAGEVSTFGLEDSKTVFNWQSEAARVPGLLERDAASTTLISTLNDRVTGLNTSLVLANNAMTDCDKMHKSDEDQKAALRDAVAASNKRAQAENRKGWYKAGAAAIVFFLAGRGTK